MDKIGKLMSCVNGPADETGCKGQTLPLSD